MTTPGAAGRDSMFSEKQLQIAIGVLVVWIVAWGLRACLLDREQAQTDNILGQATLFYEAIRDGNLRGLWPLMFVDGYHPPLPALWATPLAMAMGFSPETVRISCLLLHPVVVVQVYSLSRALYPDREVAFLACLLSATVPMLAGWFRTDFPEPLTTVLVLATLRSMFTVDLRRPWPAARLGLLVGLGALTKLSFWIFILLPAIYFAARRVRGKRSLALAALAVACALAVCGWWYLPSLDAILINFQLSRGGSEEGIRWARLTGYLWLPAGNLSMTVAAAAGALLAAWTRGVARQRLLLLLLSWVSSYLAFLLVFDFWARYIVPLIPLSCVLTALAWNRLLAWLGPRARAAALGLTAVALLVSFTALNLSSSLSVRQHLGLISPQVDSIFKQLVQLLQEQPSVAVITADDNAALQLLQRQILSTKRPSTSLVSISRAMELVEQGHEVQRIHITVEKARPEQPGTNPRQAAALDWLKRHSEHMNTFKDSSYSIRITVINREFGRP